MSRNSVLVTVGRVYQKLSVPFIIIDKLITKLISKFKSGNEPSFICILGTPRSGTTLTYQILSSAFRNIHLTNFWNLFSSTPFIGGLVSSRFKSSSNFTSNYGFVDGVFGHAEGLFFWERWTGCGLVENEKCWRIQKTLYLKQVLSHIVGRGETFISGFLGHVFVIDELRAIFPKILFIYLRRDLLSTAMSLYLTDSKNYISTRPNHLDDLNDLSREEQIAKQLIFIHKCIYDKLCNNVFLVSFEEIATDPSKIVFEIIDFARKNSIYLNTDKVSPIFDSLSFNVRKVACDDNEITSSLYDALLFEYDKLVDGDFKKFIKSLL